MNTSHWGVHATNYLPLNVPTPPCPVPATRKCGILVMPLSTHLPSRLVDNIAVPSCVVLPSRRRKLLFYRPPCRPGKKSIGLYRPVPSKNTAVRTVPSCRGKSNHITLPSRSAEEKHIYRSVPSGKQIALFFTVPSRREKNDPHRYRSRVYQ